jgi:ribosomal protein S18 acetylase RimI-like enzyme
MPGRQTESTGSSWPCLSHEGAAACFYEGCGLPAGHRTATLRCGRPGWLFVTLEIHLRPYSESNDREFLFEAFAAAGPALELSALPDSPVKAMLIEQQFRSWLYGYAAEYGVENLSVIECPAGRRVGYVWMFYSGEEHRIADLAFVPEVRGQGIGGTLVRQIAAKAFAAGLPLRASVAKSNEGSLRFNLRLGYVVMAESATHWSLEWRP